MRTADLRFVVLHSTRSHRTMLGRAAAGRPPTERLAPYYRTLRLWDCIDDTGHITRKGHDALLALEARHALHVGDEPSRRGRRLLDTISEGR